MASYSGEPAPSVGGAKAFSWPVPAPTPQGYEQEDDPFLAVPSRVKSTTGKTLLSSNCSSPDRLTLVDLDENDEDVPFESLRHKSIRRGILERLKFGTFRRAEPIASSGGESDSPSQGGRRLSWRRGHSRAESDLRVDEVKLPERTYSPRKERDVGGRKDETEWVAGSGFRIVEEDLEAIREQIRGGWGDEDDDLGRQIDFSSAPSSPAKEEFTWDGLVDDKYTALPVRKSPSKKGELGGRGLPRVDSTLLPVSPPQITSPPLESSLCFTPRIQHAQRPRNKLRSPGKA